MSVKDVWERANKSNMSVTGKSERNKIENGAKAIFQKTEVENILDLTEDINPQIQEVQQASKMTNTKTTTLGRSQSKLLKVKK